MKYLKYFLVLAMTMGLAGHVAAKSDKENKVEPVYMFGFSASFNDSLVYITDVQKVDSAVVNAKNGFLKARVAYGNQLQFYLAGEKNRPNTTCVVFFDKNKDKLNKKYQKVLNRYKKDAKTIVDVLPQSEFMFVPETNEIVSE